MEMHLLHNPAMRFASSIDRIVLFQYPYLHGVELKMYLNAVLTLFRKLCHGRICVSIERSVSLTPFHSQVHKDTQIT